MAGTLSLPTHQIQQLRHWPKASDPPRVNLAHERQSWTLKIKPQCST